MPFKNLLQAESTVPHNTVSSNLESITSSFCITHTFKIFTAKDRPVLMKSTKLRKFFSKFLKIKNSSINNLNALCQGPVQSHTLASLILELKRNKIQVPKFVQLAVASLLSRTYQALNYCSQITSIRFIEAYK